MVKRNRRREGVIMPFFSRLSGFFHHTASNGLLGRIFTSYYALNSYFLASGAGKTLNADRGSRLRRVICRNVATAVERNRVLRFFHRMAFALCLCGLRTIGLFLLVSGFYTAVMYWLSAVVWDSTAVSWLSLPTGLASMLVGILLLFSDHSLGDSLRRGLFFKSVLSDALGFSDDVLKRVPENGKQHYLIAVPAGMLVGALAAWLHPLWVLGVALLILLVATVITVPETGVLLFILFLPFSGFLPYREIGVTVAVLLPLFGYLGKLLRGNRTFHVQIQDLPVMLFAALLLFSSFSIKAGALRGALLSVLMLLSYFLITNVMGTPSWIRRCQGALLTSATVASGVGILQFALAMIENVNRNATISSFGSVVRAGFADHTTFAYFLCIAFPVAFSTLIGSRRQYRVMAGLCCLLMLGALSLTFVQSAWITAAVLLVVFLLLYRPQALLFVLLGGGVTATAYAVLPTRLRLAVARMLQSGAGVVSSRISISEVLFSRVGALSRLSGAGRLLFGYGYGGFESVCRILLLADPAQTAFASGLWPYLLVEFGLLGVIFCAVFLFLLLQNCFSVLHVCGAKTERICAISGIGVVIAVLLMGLFRYVWYDPVAMAMFFVVTALISAELRLIRAQHTVSQAQQMTSSYAELDYYIGG